MIYKVEITETLQKVVEVEADTLNEAILKVCEGYNHEQHILDANDFVGVDIKEYKE